MKTVSPRVHDCWNKIGVWSGEGRSCPRLEKYAHCRNCHVYAWAGRRFLDQAMPEEYIDEQTRLIGEPPREKRPRKSVFVFRAGNEWLAMPSDLIQEVVPMGVIHPIPHRGGNILKGLVNVRGRLELCFSIGAVLGIEREPRNRPRQRYVSPERLVVGTWQGNHIVFPVSEIRGTVRYNDAMIRDLPVTVSRAQAVYTRGIICINGEDVGFLNEKLLMEALLRSLS